MDEAARLLAIEEISMLKARYFLGVDTQDWDLLRNDVLSPDVTFQLSEFREEPYAGVDEVLAMFADGLNGMASVHHGHTPIIEITSETTATGLWAMVDRIYWASGGAGIDNELYLLGFGHYHETYVKRAQGWRIATIRLTRLRRETRSIG